MAKIVSLIPKITRTPAIQPVKNQTVPMNSAPVKIFDLSKALHTTFTNISKKQVKSARRMDKSDAARYYFDIIANSMAIPDELRPQLIIKDIDSEAPKLCGCYDNSDNTLTYFAESKRNKKAGKWWTFGLIRHEMEHFRQYLDIYRNRDTFDELCKYYVKIGKEQNIAPDTIDEAISSLHKSRNNILKYYTETDKNSSDYKKTKKYLDSAINYQTYDYKDIKQCLKYFLQPMEFDACKAQGLNWINYFKTLLLG